MSIIENNREIKRIDRHKYMSTPFKKMYIEFLKSKNKRKAINKKDSFGNTLIHYTMMEDNYDILERVLSHFLELDNDNDIERPNLYIKNMEEITAFDYYMRKIINIDHDILNIFDDFLKTNKTTSSSMIQHLFEILTDEILSCDSMYGHYLLLLQIEEILINAHQKRIDNVKKILNNVLIDDISNIIIGYI